MYWEIACKSSLSQHIHEVKKKHVEIMVHDLPKLLSSV
jgi:hypothetical protein